MKPKSPIPEGAPTHPLWVDIQRIAEGGTFAQLLEFMRSKTKAPAPVALPAALLPRAALVRSIDKKVYEEILVAGMEAPPFDEFSGRAEVEKTGTQSCALRDAERTQYLSYWKDQPESLLAMSARLAEFYGRAGNAFDQFLHSLFAEPGTAVERFLTRYAELDQSFALSGCEALLRVLRLWLLILPADLLTAVNDREQYLRSRTLFAEDYYRTVVHLKRETQADAFEEFIDDPNQWIMHLHGDGGVGKTLFLRWLIARRCIPELDGKRIPVARVDIDTFDRRGLGDFPLLLFLPLATQLTQQLPEAPFTTVLLSLRDYEALLHRPNVAHESKISRDALKIKMTASGSSIADLPHWFASALGSERVLVILDTIEDMLLHQRAQLLDILELLSKVHGRCPTFKLILSGRYNLAAKGRLPEFTSAYPGQIRTVPVGNFSQIEAGKYLTDLRNIRNPDVVEAIWKKTKGHPLDLTLFGDIAAHNTEITATEVRNLPEQYARLIERIIDRIPDEQRSLRWLLRYAVVPRRLDLNYIHRVINVPVRRESRGKPVRDNTKKYPPGRAQERYGKQERWQPLAKPRMDEAWEQLRSYAAQTSWVIEDGGAIRLQPEIVEPMRALLRMNRIYKELQRRSQKYFEHLANERSHEWGQWMEEAIYHRFQRDAAGAGAYWVKQLGKARQQGFADLEHVAGVVFGPEFLDDDRHPVLKISPTSVARASFDLAYATLIKRLRVRNEHPECKHYDAQLAQRWEDLKFYARGSASHAVSHAKRHLIEAAVLAYTDPATSKAPAQAATVPTVAPNLKTSKIPARAVRLATAAASTLKESRYRLAAEMLLASRIYWPILRKAKPHFVQAIRIARKTNSVDLPSSLLDFLLARVHLYADDLQGAIVHFKRSSLGLADLRGNGGPDPATIFRRTAETLYEAGALREALELQQTARAATEQRPYLQFQWLYAETRLRLRLGEFDAALAACNRAGKVAPDPQLKGVQAELAGEVEAARCCIEQGNRLFEQAEAVYQESGSYLGIPTCRLKTARMYLDSLGNATRALELIGSVDTTLSTSELQLEYFTLRVRALARTNAKEAARAWRRDFKILEKREFSLRSRAAFLVLGLALGFGQADDLRKLWPLLAKVRPVSAVYGILKGFALFAGAAPAPSQALRLKRYAPRVNIKSPNSVLASIAYSHALRYLGADREAVALLDKISRAVEYFPGLERLIRTARFQADPHSYLLKPAPSRSEVRVNLASDPYRLRFVEEAERAAFVHDLAKASEFLTASSYSEWPSWLERSQWGVRAHLIAAQLEGVRAKQGNRQLTSAENIAREMGNALPEWADEALVSIHHRTFSESELDPDAIRVEIKIDAALQIVADWHGHDDRSGSSRIERTYDAETQVTHSVRANFDFVRNLLGSKPLPVQLTNARPLSSAPWESLFPPEVVVYRVPPSGPRFTDTIIAIQRALLRKGVKVAVDGILGPETTRALRRFSDDEPATLRRILLEPQPPRGRILIVQPDIEQARSLKLGHGSEGLRAFDLYRKAGLDVTEHIYRDTHLLSAAMMDVQPTLIHLITGFWKTSSGEIQLDLSSIDAKPLSARHLTSVFLNLKKRDSSSPVLLVEAVTPPSDYEVVRQGNFRNSFCAELAATGRMKAILATGFWPRGTTEGKLARLIERINGRSTVGDLFVASASSNWAPALFTSDPCLPLWEA
jgi:hypothetical protein